MGIHNTGVGRLSGDVYTWHIVTCRSVIKAQLCPPGLFAIWEHDKVGQSTLKSLLNT